MCVCVCGGGGGGGGGGHQFYLFKDRLVPNVEMKCSDTARMTGCQGNAE